MRVPTLVGGIVVSLVVVGCGSDEPLGRDEAASQVLAGELEPNQTAATATPIADTAVVIGDIFPSGDVDVYAFDAVAGDRIYAATMTATSASTSTDTTIALYAADGTTLIESDTDDGSFAAAASVLAGTAIPVDGTYYLEVFQPSDATQLRPYYLHFVKRAAPGAEAEPNDVVPQPITGDTPIAGALANQSDVDAYAIELAAGDTVFAALDLDPDRDGSSIALSTLTLAPIGAGAIAVNDAGVAGPDAEALFATVDAEGIYAIEVTGGESGGYVLSVVVHPAAAPPAGCVTYTNTTALELSDDVPGTSEITIPDDLEIGDLDVQLAITHPAMADLDVRLISPRGDEIGLFSDIATPVIDARFDDEAALPLVAGLAADGLAVQPENAFRLRWLDGGSAAGTWTLRIDDDTIGNTGTLERWGLTVCPAAAPPACAAGLSRVAVYTADFETTDDGFIHAGPADEWERGTPSAAPIADCHGGAGCWKTDLDGGYDASSDQILASPPIDLTGFEGPFELEWAQKYQLENAQYDHAWVDVSLPGGEDARRVFEHRDGTMAATMGATLMQQAAGWAVHRADVSSYALSGLQVTFHLDSDAVGHYAGMAIDDVRVTGCVNLCGNDAVDPGEDCDDGNTDDGDGCSASCLMEEEPGDDAGDDAGDDGGDDSGGDDSGGGGGGCSTGGGGAGWLLVVGLGAAAYLRRRRPRRLERWV
jgi:MYXO-CTERM domain-containing protein